MYVVVPIHPIVIVVVVLYFRIHTTCSQFIIGRALPQDQCPHPRVCTRTVCTEDIRTTYIQYENNSTAYVCMHVPPPIRNEIELQEAQGEKSS